ncbi:YHYH domain-containing protein [Cupriavidus pinatubonensis]|uniref:YHYH domain-containing protein n=1 Tax=Cupriavidus pinatubonensis TaxID=248026 RepID=UPI00296254B6|nr:YHYH domain-containing protein [Cupriavidus pinatubonensis]
MIPMNGGCLRCRAKVLRIWSSGLIFFSLAGTAGAHGGGLNAEGCHTNRKTGEYHCQRGRGPVSSSASPGASTLAGGSAKSLEATPRGSGAGPVCYTGPRGGMYTITASGRKNYGGC